MKYTESEIINHLTVIGLDKGDIEVFRAHASLKLWKKMDEALEFTKDYQRGFLEASVHFLR